MRESWCRKDLLESFEGGALGVASVCRWALCSGRGYRSFGQLRVLAIHDIRGHGRVKASGLWRVANGATGKARAAHPKNVG